MSSLPGNVADGPGPLVPGNSQGYRKGDEQKVRKHADLGTKQTAIQT